MVLVSSDYDGPGRDERDERWARLDCTRPGYLVSSRPTETSNAMTGDDDDDDGDDQVEHHGTG